MISARRFSTWIIAAACSLALAPSPLVRPGLAQELTCAGGSSTGSWKLPRTSMGSGFTHGRLIDSTTHQIAYRFRALLTDVPSPCLSCIEGEVQGFLDHGSGAPPDFAVRGHYLGSIMGGSGQFDLRVFRTTGGPTVGYLSGTFEDAPGDGLPGRFTGSWRICQ